MTNENVRYAECCFNCKNRAWWNPDSNGYEPCCKYNNKITTRVNTVCDSFKMKSKKQLKEDQYVANAYD